jgi:hypothetical protein
MVQAFTSNRGINALVPAELHQNVFTHEKDKGARGSEMAV